MTNKTKLNWKNLMNNCCPMCGGGLLLTNVKKCTKCKYVITISKFSQITFMMLAEKRLQQSKDKNSSNKIRKIIKNNQHYE